MKTLRIVRSNRVAASEAAIDTLRRIVNSQPGVGVKLMRGDAYMSLSAPGVKTFDKVEDKDGRTIDYRDVKIKGYLSTWEHVTKSDRQGDYVIKGAFSETIADFMRNPVLLADHRNNTESIAGSFEAVAEDNIGLYVEASLSNSPAPAAADIRFKVAEGHLRTLSMGGVFYYNEDGRGIFKVNLWEGSLVAIPANPDALISVRALTDDDMKALRQ